MDDQVNAIIDLDVTRLNFPLRPLYARRYKSFVALLRNAPADVQAVKIRLWKAGDRREGQPHGARRGRGACRRVRLHERPRDAGRGGRHRDHPRPRGQRAHLARRI